MATYHQMGAGYRSLLRESHLFRFQGAIFSPVNEDPEVATALSNEVRDNSKLEILFDPQLYVPKSNRGKLPKWKYFPKDVYTTDLSQLNWWRKTALGLAQDMATLRPHAVCSPAFIPNIYSNAYFDLLVRIHEILANDLTSSNIKTLQTLIVSTKELTAPDKPLEIASIVSRGFVRRVYLVLVTDVEPRRELDEGSQIAASMQLIRALEDAGIEVLVGFCSYDLVLWKAAGASSCATGKFFNLRRFTPSRFEDESGGGGQLPYWFEEGLFALLREPDVLRLRKIGVSQATMLNPYTAEILDILDKGTGESWIAQGWRHYLHGVAELEYRLSIQHDDAAALLEQADNNWKVLDRAKFLMDERNNDGSWVRTWRQALNEFEG
jgi:hypothetical protein